MENLLIRKAVKSDAEQIVKMSNAVWRITYAHIFPQEVFDQRDRMVDSHIARCVSGTDAEGYIHYVAADGDKIIACALALVNSFYEHYAKKGYADLMGIYVHQDYQRRGIGKKLFDKVVSDLIESGHSKMTIGVLKENISARKAYEKWGGILDTTYQKPFVKLGNEYPEVFYLFDLTRL